jgi:hypothetical protein
MKLVALTPLLLFPIIAQAGVYRCEHNGEIEYSQTPCGDDALEINVNTYTSPPRSEGDDNATTTDQGTSPAATEGVDEFLERRRLQRQIASLERDKERLVSERDRKLEALKDQMRRTDNRARGAELQLEAINVEDDYNRRIYELNKQLRQLKRG